MAIVDRRGALLSAAGGVVSGADDPGDAIKAPVRVATTGANIALTGLQTIDGIALGVGDRVLVKDQTFPTLNGLYNASVGAWVRTVDANSADNIVLGMLVPVAQGAINAGALYELNGPVGAITVGSSLFTFKSVATELAMQAVFDGGGVPLSPNMLIQCEVASRFTARRWTLLGGNTGSIDIDILKAPFASLPLSAGNSITTGGVRPTLAAAQFNQSTNLTGWQTGFNAGEIVGFNIVSVIAVQKVTLSLWGSRP